MTDHNTDNLALQKRIGELNAIIIMRDDQLRELQQQLAASETRNIVGSGIAKKCAEEIVHLLGVGHVNDIDHFIDKAMDEATRLIFKSATATGAELLKTQVENQSLRTALDGAMADKERLDWLESNPGDIRAFSAGGWSVEKSLAFPTLRQAIDVAMANPQEPA